MMKLISLLALMGTAISGVSAANCTVDDDCGSTKQVCDFGTCKCGDGWVALAGLTSNFCVDLDECAMGLDNCDSDNGYCVDYDPEIKYECGCQFGYVCQDTPACTRCIVDTTHACNINNGGCSSSATCTALANNGTKCTCNDGYTGDGTTCTVDNSSPTSTPAPTASTSCDTKVCQDGAECSIVSGTPTCSCKTGYVQLGSGVCVDIDECLSENLNDCTQNRSVCTNEGGGYSCICETGFTDFPATIRGTDCRTEEEIELAFSVGGIYEVTTGLSGISISDFSEGSVTREAVIAYYAEKFDVNTTDITFGNITSVTTTRRLSSGRSLQVSGVSYRMIMRFPFVSVSPASYASALRQVSRKLAAASDFFEEVETGNADFIADYLDDVATALNARSAVFNSASLAATPVVAYTIIQVTVPISEITIQRAIDLGLADNGGISNALIQSFQSAGFSGTPSASPTMNPSQSRRMLEIDEEEDFFGDWAVPSCKCVDCDSQSGCEDLWKGRDVAVSSEALPKGKSHHVVVSHCNKDLGWLSQYLSDISVSSITIVSTCGKSPVNVPPIATLVSTNADPIMSWITASVNEEVNGNVLFLSDETPTKQQTTASHMLTVAEMTSFACGVVPESSENMSISAYCKGDKGDLAQMCKSTNFATTMEALRSSGIKSAPQSWAAVLSKPLTPEEIDSLMSYSNGEVDGCLSHNSGETPESFGLMGAVKSVLHL
eukprot:CAMPEP_0202461436 /NCGR_PEP_ID=MMETSP1360-20130828/49377_1 /ASSEMBLY_ACC=CAM_ASM_000848 /TAXON_ID=515479 /ORGANISM="Licmophora paradoxa, Strain CCMP2313" /LENGTH=719 /DNA_ID=CAMNT_0049083473 /DNA_START=25 /DNA_END=2184 /DNA_ORIENTATION=+